MNQLRGITVFRSYVVSTVMSYVRKYLSLKSCQEEIAIQEFRKHIGGAMVSYNPDDKSLHVLVSNMFIFTCLYSLHVCVSSIYFFIVMSK